MAKRAKWLIITFENVSEAIRLEKFCRRMGIPGQLIPTPHFINASCSMSWRSDPSQRTVLINIITRYNICIKDLREIMI
ncbi:MAG: DUF3343 domain-containing protein [Bacillota bacterium]|jgi:hypothetical protein